MSSLKIYNKSAVSKVPDEAGWVLSLRPSTADLAYGVVYINNSNKDVLLHVSADKQEVRITSEEVLNEDCI